MTAALLGWDPVWPEVWQPDYQAAAAGAAESGFFRAVWDISGAAEELEAGADVWFTVPGERAGVAGHGVVVSSPYGFHDEDRRGQRDQPVLVDIDIDALLPLEEHIPLVHLPPVLAGLCPGGGDLTILDSSTETDLRHAWARNVSSTNGLGPALLPGSLPQAAVRWSLTSRYESDPDAARIALAHYGPSCSVCGFDPETVFGREGAGIMQVHHIVPARLVTDDYDLDAAVDLVPLCGNCHAMAHSGFPDPFSPAELRAMLAAQGVSPHAAHVASPGPEQLRAEADARALLGLGGRENDWAARKAAD
ncbi:hypothetical protein FYJ28_16685 [Arthrobacter sp. BL-252-APC-1A]|uniref:HNH endonuclease n=1 Tax=Arthrobacter sp. BL-252-APC-1A TaxID=2606622 RepID=UPI0012B229AC|nr:hypothetical protein [Arthrobacter sp. BL-252-APC-1A]MSS00439.1 hypothetical protein [Arthrobacter sp. BL-252-APC-1A]